MQVENSVFMKEMLSLWLAYNVAEFLEILFSSVPNPTSKRFS